MDGLERCKQEWERTLLGSVVALLMAAGAVLLFMVLREDEGTSNRSGALPADPRFFDASSMAFLDAPTRLEGVNPLQFRHKIDVMPVTSPRQGLGNWGGVPSRPAPWRPSPAQVQTRPKEESAQVVANATPPRRLKVLYAGYSAVEGTPPKAWVTVAEDAENKKQNGRFQQGEKLLDTLTIQSFDPEQLVVSWGNGQQTTIYQGKKNEQEVTIDHE